MALLFLFAPQQTAEARPAALEPASNGGVPALDRALQRLSTHRRLLMIAAHPDDEDTALLTWVARARAGEAAYLSLSRGEGGQNLIGAELGADLGLLRSRELLAARGIDGAHQFFSRAFDFGYTRSLDETFERWPKEALLEDTVRVIRRFRPQVVVAIFPPDARAGHGQHQASGVVAHEALALAADPEAFPHLLAEGLPPWQVEAFYRRARGGEDDGPTVAMGEIDPWAGRSILQIALESRSQHRCQDMGSLQPLGDYASRLLFVDGKRHDEFFTPTRMPVPAMARILDDPALQDAMEERLQRIEALALRAREELRASAPAAVAPLLADLHRQLVDAERALETAAPDRDPRSPVLHVLRLLQEKQGIAAEALAGAAQIFADAVTDREILLPGQELEAQIFFWNAGPHAVEGLEIEIRAEEEWLLLDDRPAEPGRSRFSARVDSERHLRLRVPDTASPTLPYFRKRPTRGFLYDWSKVPAEQRGEPFEAPPIRLVFRFRVLGADLALEREVVQRVRDQARGEVRRPLRIVPPIEIGIEPSLLVVARGDKASRVEIEVRSHLERPTGVRVEARTPAGWPAVDPMRVEVEEPKGSSQLEIEIPIPPDARDGHYGIEFVAVDEMGRRFGHALPLVDYEHVRATPTHRTARLELALGELEWPELQRVGYVRGASDRIPESLLQAGVPLEILPARALAEGNLSRFDAIVIGPRAFEVEPALARANARLLRYAEAGGLVIVQYQQYFFAGGDFAPYPFDIDRPHDRVTDETASVRLLEPTHPVFTNPNPIRATDWDHWVQERGLYFAGTWAAQYQPLLAMVDPGGDEQLGGLLVTKLGRGTWVYTGLAFFRQLPAGVVGAYRLFANLLGLASAPESADSASTGPKEVRSSEESSP